MTILQTTTVAAPIPWLVLGALICFNIAFDIMISGTESDVIKLIAVISFFIGLILGALSLNMAEETTRYQVLLDDTYTVSELYENYEIVEQEGITYWIEEKDNED